jgi:nucleoside-diphosphate-sugar epimerase
MMRALVTGSSGFLGSYLTELLIQRGIPVAILCRQNSDPWRIRHLLPYVTRITGDIEELEKAETAIEAFGPDTVFHLAWFGAGNEYRNDEEQIHRNLFSALALLKLAIRIKCSTWIGVGSQAEYGPSNCIVSETSPTRPSTMYGAVKLSTYLLTRQIALAAGIRHSWVRPFSAYGPKDNPTWMIPYVILTLLRRQRPALTRCEQRWDYIYVTDVAEALYEVAVTPSAYGVFNLGSGTGVTLHGVVEQIRDLIDPNLPLGFGEVPYRPDQVMHLQADIEKLKAATQWCPIVPLGIGLASTVAWYRDAA